MKEQSFKRVYLLIAKAIGLVAQLVRAPPCHGGVVGSNPIRVVVIISQMITCWKQLTIISGVLAQLGEHLPYKQRVTGSSPVGPINFADLAQWQSS